MNRRDIIVGALLLLFLGIFFIWFLRNKSGLPNISKTPSPQISPLGSPVSSVLEEKLKSRFNIEIPQDQEKIELKDVSGGDGSGIATRNFENGKYNLVVLADLPSPSANAFYEVWLVRGDAEISVGKLTMAKGGWLLDYTSSVNYTDYNKVVITSEKINDGKPETKILEASF